MTTGPDDAQDHTGRTLRTLEHCALHKRTIRLTCPACGHVRLLDALPLWWLFVRRGWDDRVPGAVKRRLFCEACKGKGRVRPNLRSTRETPEGPQPPYPDRHEWKRVVSRYRS